MTSHSLRKYGFRMWYSALLVILIAVNGITQTLEHFGLEEGLPSLDCFDMCQGPNGFVWISTSNGFVRYDGSTFRTWLRDPSTDTTQGSDEIRNIESSPDGRVYFSIGGDSRLRYFDQNEKTFHVIEDPKNHYPDSCLMTTMITHIHVATADSVWLATGDLWLYRPSTGQVVRHFQQVLAGERVKTINEDGRDKSKLWVGAINKAIHLDLITGQAEVYEIVAGEGGCHTANWSFQDILDEGNNRIWVASWGGGVVEISKDERACRCHYFDDYPPYDGAKNIARELVRKDEGEIWVASENGPLIFHEESRMFEKLRPSEPGPSINEYRSLGMLLTFDGATLFNGSNGIYKLDPDLNRFTAVRIDSVLRDPQSTHVFSPVKTQNAWVSPTSAEVAVVFDLRGNQELKEWDADNGIMSLLHSTDDQRVLALMNKSLVDLDLNSFKVNAMSDLPLRYNYSLGSLMDSKNRLWMSSQGRPLVRVDIDSDERRTWDLGEGEYNLPDLSWNQAIAEDNSGNVWISGLTEVCRIDSQTDKVQPFHRDTVPWLPGAAPVDLEFDSFGHMWIATRGDGIIRRKPEWDPDRFDQYTHATGLGHNQFSSLAIRNQVLVAAGMPGLVVMKIDSAGPTDVRSFDPLSGLGDFDLNHVPIAFHNGGWVSLTKNNRIIFFKPEELFDTPQEQAVIYSDFGGEMEIDAEGLGKIELKAGSSSLELKLGVIAFRSPVSIEYRYSFSAGEASWKETEDIKSLRFDQLSPDNYELKIQSRYPGGVWTTGYALQIVVLPFFYQTMWFKMLLALLAIFVIVVIVRNRERNSRQKELMRSEFEKQLAEVEMTALRAQMNPHFLFNSLNSINRYILKNDGQKASDYLTKFSKLMRLILQNSKKPLVPLSQELEALRLYVEMEAVRFDGKFRFEMTTSPDLELDFIELPPLILQPYVENAIWHGLMHKESEGLLTLSVRKQDSGLLFVIEDNGVGRKMAEELKSKSAQSHKSMGMRITSERMDLSDRLHDTSTEVRITDLVDAMGEAAGTRVEISLVNT